MTTKQSLILAAAIILLLNIGLIIANNELRNKNEIISDLEKRILTNKVEVNTGYTIEGINFILTDYSREVEEDYKGNKEELVKLEFKRELN